MGIFGKIGAAFAALLAAGQMVEYKPKPYKRPHISKPKQSFMRWWTKGVQGEREKSRRLRQIAQGIISRDQLYIHPE